MVDELSQNELIAAVGCLDSPQVLEPIQACMA
jgi:hypothetical protein